MKTAGEPKHESHRSAMERRVREAWLGEPGVVLRLLSVLYGAAVDLRNVLYDRGRLRSDRLPLPVVSVGGLTVGGSGKTPITAELANRLGQHGIRVAILTHGFADEIHVHRTLSPSARVYGGRDRLALGERAAAEGAEIALLDSGMQYRRMSRDLELIVLDEEALALAPRRLPAGPFRERPESLARADLLVLVRRVPGADQEPAAAEIPTGRLGLGVDRGRGPRPPIVRVQLRPGELVPANAAAEIVAAPAPRAAVAGVMWPRSFFVAARRLFPCIETDIALPDHAVIGGRTAARLRAAGLGGGIVCTLKDASGLVHRLGNDAPIWYLSEELVWEGDGAAIAMAPLLSLLHDSANSGASGRDE